MLCYRCGSYTPDGSRACDVCGQPFAERRRTGRTPSLAGGGAPRHVPPYEENEVVVGRYRVRAAVALGASGWVLRARDEEVDVDVALKVILPNLLQTEDERARFIKTVKRMRKAQHANTVRIYGEGRDERRLYYTMPYLEGLSLRKIIDLRREKEQVFKAAETLPLVSQLAAALDSLAKVGGHGGLRPSNVMVLPDLLKVTGLPHVQGLPRPPLMALYENSGMVEYVAPEVAKEEVGPSVRADIYSLAVIAAEMLTGQVFGRNQAAWAAAQSMLPGRLASVIARGLLATANARYATAADFFDALLDAAGPTAVPPAAEDGGPQPVPHSEEPTPVVYPSDPTVEMQRRRPHSPRRSDTVTAVASTQAARSVTPEKTVRIADRQTSAQSRAGPRPKSALGSPMRRRSGGSPGLIIAAVVILLSGIAISTALWWQRRDATIPLEPVDPVDQSVRPMAGEPTAVAGTRGRAKGKGKGKGKSKRVARQDRPRRDSGREKERPRPEPAPPPEAAKRPELEPAPLPKPVEPVGAPRQPVVPPRPLPPAPRAPEPEFVPAPLPAPQPKVALAPEPAARSCPAGMVKIDAATFTMGTHRSDPMRGFGDRSAHQRNLKSYCIDEFEYPNQRGRSPMVNVSWSRALSLCQKRGKRLCAEAEWEYACKGPGGRRYPTGNGRRPDGCNTGGDGRKPAPAGVFARCRSGFGVVDLSGNVAEWTSGRFASDLPDRVVKGGAADQAHYTGRCSARSAEEEKAKSGMLGFRCCMPMH